MKKAIFKIIIIVLIASVVLFGMFEIEDRVAQAFVPLVYWVAIPLISLVVVGAYKYFISSGGSELVGKVSAVGGDGSVDLDKMGYYERGNAMVFDENSGFGTLMVAAGLGGGWICSWYFNEKEDALADCNYVSDRVYELRHGDYWQVWYWGKFQAEQSGVMPPAKTTSNTYYQGVAGGGFVGSDGVTYYENEVDVIEDPDSCFDGIMNQDETGVDCGGVCDTNWGFVCPWDLCDNGILDVYEVGIDCGGVCDTYWGYVCSTCSDGVQNQDETGIDCGGVCPPCPTCLDGIQNGDETGIDCGGTWCAPCPTCSDGIQNGDETGIDCGGVCPDCSTCLDGIQNQGETGIDCGGTWCPDCPTCSDGIQNGDETGIDCGGTWCPPCTSEETCSDGVQNQDETGIDCGGVCPPCPTCSDGIQNGTETGIDYGGVCGTCNDGEQNGNETGVDIGGRCGGGGGEGEVCIDLDNDGLDDISGYSCDGGISIGVLEEATENTYDASLPGDVSEIGDTNWTGLITGFLSSNPLVLLATGNQINLSGEECTLTANVFGTDIVIDFCVMESMIDLIGVFVLGLMAIRSVFIAMGI